MVKFRWEQDDFAIDFYDPYITPHSHVEVADSFDEVMYFYYRVDVYVGGELVLRAMSHDWPKVQDLHDVIQMMLGRDLSGRYLYEDIDESESMGYTIKSYYDRVLLVDSFHDAAEYMMKIERDYSLMTGMEHDELETFSFEVGKNMLRYTEEDQFDGITDVVKSYRVCGLSREDIDRLAGLAKSFCEYALIKHREDMEEEFVDGDTEIGYSESGEFIKVMNDMGITDIKDVVRGKSCMNDDDDLEVWIIK